MARRYRGEFKELEDQLEPEAQARQWRALIDKVLYNKGPGPEPIVEQLRLRERLRTLHARRDRYNQKRYARKFESVKRCIGPRHVIATLAIRTGLVEPEEGPCPRDLLIGAMVGDRRLFRKFLEELETVHETIFPVVPPWEIDHRLVDTVLQSQPAVRAERHAFEQALKPTPLPTEPPAKIPFGNPVPLPDQSDAPEHQDTPPAARAAS